MAGAGNRRVARSALRAWLAPLVCAGFVVAPAAQAQSTLAPAAASPEFAQKFTAGDYAGALPLAEAEAIAQAKSSPGSVAHVTALLNLASTRYKLGDYAAAIDGFAEAVKLAGDVWGDNSPRSISPLRGLGMSLLAQQRTAEAVPVLARAVALSRRHMGLFNDDQYAMAQPLARAYQQLGMIQEAEREEQYAFRAAESRYGTDDLRMLPAMDRLARWYEETSRPAQARYLHRRAFTLATDPKKTTASGAVRALVGVARTYFIEFRDGPEVAEEDNPFPNGNARLVSQIQQTGPQIPQGYYLDPQAERALQLAIMIADKSGIAALRQEATLTYGDYLLLDGKAASAEKQYALSAEFRNSRIATGELSALEPDPLAKPHPLLVRRPNFTQRNWQAAAEDVNVHTTALTATVTPQGKVEQVKVVSSDDSAAHQRLLVTAAERAVYRPAYVEGKATATEGVELAFTSRSLKSERTPPKPEAKAASASDAATPTPTPE